MRGNTLMSGMFVGFPSNFPEIPLKHTKGRLKYSQGYP